jgi:hypothetical protein
MVSEMNLFQKESQTYSVPLLDLAQRGFAKMILQLSQNMPPYGLVTTPE